MTAGAIKQCCKCEVDGAPQNKTAKKGTTMTDGDDDGDSSGFLRLEIADEEIREQVNKHYYGNRSFFLDKMQVDDGGPYSVPTPHLH